MQAQVMYRNVYPGSSRRNFSTGRMLYKTRKRLIGKRISSKSLKSTETVTSQESPMERKSYTRRFNGRTYIVFYVLKIVPAFQQPRQMSGPHIGSSKMHSRTVLCIHTHGQRESLCFDPMKCALWHPRCSLYYQMITGPVDGAP